MINMGHLALNRKQLNVTHGLFKCNKIGLEYYGDNEDETAENFAQYREWFQGFLLMGLASLLFEVALDLTWLRTLP